MASSDFEVFDANGTNIEAQAAYAGSATQTGGFSSGIVPSPVFNKILRQGTAMAAMLGNFILSALNVNVADDGTITTNQANFIKAIQSCAIPAVRPILSYASTTQVGVSVGGAGGIYLGSALTKSTAGAWVAGSGNGMGAGLTITAGTWYHVFLIINGGAPDAYLDTSVTGANAPAGTTAKVRIGSVLTNGSSQIISFVQNGSTFMWSVPIQQLNGVAGATSATTITLATVPPGVVVKVLLAAGLNTGAVVAGILYISQLTVTDEAPSAVFFTFLTATPTNSASFGQAEVLTNASAQIRIRNANTTDLNYMTVLGWSDPNI